MSKWLGAIPLAALVFIALDTTIGWWLNKKDAEGRDQ